MLANAGSYSVIKRNAFESIIVRWMNLEPVTQKRQRKTNIYKHIFMESIKMVPICRSGTETHIEN